MNYLYRLNPQDQEVRLFKAKVLRQLAYLSTGANCSITLADSRLGTGRQSSGATTDSARSQGHRGEADNIC